MERQDIVRFFLKEGAQLDSQSIDYFEKHPEEIKNALEKTKNQQNKPKIFTLDFFQAPKTETRIEVLKYYNSPKKHLKVEDYTKILTNRFEKIKNILNGRSELENLVSINRVVQNTKKFSLVGVVEEKDEYKKAVAVSDLTGELYVHFEGGKEELFNQLVLDEIVGLVCSQKDKIFVVEKVVWPDISLKREINRTSEDVYCLFLSDLHMDSNDFKKDSYEKFLSWMGSFQHKLHVFVLGNVSERKEQAVDFFKQIPENAVKFFVAGERDPKFTESDLKNTIINPSTAKIDNVTIFINHGDIIDYYKKQWPSHTVENILQLLLKKRHLNPSFRNDGQFFDDNSFILDTIPDIIAIGHTHNPALANYKGTTIITTGSFLERPIFWLINLKTREVNKLDFT